MDFHVPSRPAPPPRPIIVFGAGDFARIAHPYATGEGGWNIPAFVVDSPADGPSELCGTPVMSFEEALERFPPRTHDAFVAIGYSGANQRRAEAFDRVRAAGYRLASFVSPRAYVTGDVVVGENVFVFEANVMQPGVVIGDDVVLWSGNHIGHDVTIEDHCFLASHVVLSGHVRVGHHTFIGVNATVRDGVTIGPRNVIGAAAIVMRDTEDGDVLATRHTELHRKRSWELAL